MTFQDALRMRGVKFRTTANGKTHLNCPFCAERGKGGDTQFRLCVHVGQGWGRCMHCDWKSRHAVPAVLRQLGIAGAVSGSDRADALAPAPPVRLPRDFTVLTQTFDELEEHARAYLFDRGITKEQIRQYRIGISFSDRYAYRIIFPVYANNELRGIVARDFTGHQQPKYLNSQGEKYLFGFDPKAETCILAEGVFKALRLQRVTPHCTAAVLGHDLTAAQLTQVRESACKTIIIYPDPDNVGRKGAVGIADKLSDMWRGNVLIASPVMQPADEAPLSILTKTLANPLQYNWGVRQKILLAI